MAGGNEMHKNCCFQHAYLPPFTTPQQWQQDFCLQNACELVSPHIHSIQPTSRVLDLGCGNGYISACLSKLVTSGLVLGIDFSSEAIQQAELDYYDVTHLKFKRANITEFTTTDKFDWVFAFSSLHWLNSQEQLKLLTNIRSLLSEEGKGLFTLGTRHKVIWNVIDAVVDSKRWRDYFTSFANPRSFYTRDSYARLLQESGFDSFSVDNREVRHTFTDKKQLESFVIGWLPQVEVLPQHLRAQFIEEISDKYLEQCPAKPSGEVEIVFNNLEVMLAH